MTHTPIPHRPLVTGAHGFLGRRLCAALRERGLDPWAPTSSELDLLDRDAIRSSLQREQPALVFHLAARVGGIGANQLRPAELFHDNAIMGIQLLDECWRAGTAKVVSVGTVCAYPAFTPVPFEERALWDGYPEATNAPYGLAKKMLLVQSQAYRAQYGFNGVVVLPANLYGPGDNFDLESSHVIPAIVRKVAAAKAVGAPSVKLWGDGSPTREFLFVDDCVAGLIATAERYDDAEALNLGTGIEISIAELAQQITAIMGFTGRIDWEPTQPNGQLRRRLDVTRARDLIGFNAETTLDEGLRQTIQWWQKEGA